MAEEVNMERIYVGHMNVMLVVKGLRRKDYISEEALNALIDSCIKERADQQEQLKQHNVHFDGVDTVLYTAMKLHVLTELELISDECAMRQLCIECDGMLMRKSLDFTKNHNFLGKFPDRIKRTSKINLASWFFPFLFRPYDPYAGSHAHLCIQKGWQSSTSSRHFSQFTIEDNRSLV